MSPFKRGHLHFTMPVLRIRPRPRVERLMAPFAGAYERELLNVQDRPASEDAFPRDAVNLLRETSRDVNVCERDHRLVFIAIDPNAGGMSQQAAMAVLRMPVRDGTPSIVVRSPFFIRADPQSSGATARASSSQSPGSVAAGARRTGRPGYPR